MEGLPHGTVTFLFSDIEGSTRRWEHQSDGLAGVLAQHDQILGAAIAEAGGHLVKHTGDGVLAAFGAASVAVRAAVAGGGAVAGRAAAHRKRLTSQTFSSPS